ncbi:MAG: ABC transporter permease [Anaerolineaceae bacterium]|nr:ABC transporter permease [Anaerolineaceae bacterium]
MDAGSLPQTPTQSYGRSGLAAELRALLAVVRKEWLLVIRYPSWILAVFVWPVIFPLMYILSARALSGPDGSGLAVFRQLTGVQDYIGFIVVGTTVWMWQNIVLWQVGGKLRNEQVLGTLESNWLSPTWRFSFLIGGSLVPLVQMLFFMAVTALEFGLFFSVRFHGNPLLALLVLLASIPSIYGIGMAFASLVINMKESQSFVSLLRGVVMVFCGITFPISVLPPVMQRVAAWLPQTYTIQAFRNAALANADLTALTPDLLRLLAFGIVWLLAGYSLFQWMDRRARHTGAIGQF